MDTIEQKVRDIVLRHLRVSAADLKLESSFINDLGGDSLDTVEMLLAVEDEFNLEIDEDVAEGLDTVQKVIDYITQETNK